MIAWRPWLVALAATGAVGGGVAALTTGGSGAPRAAPVPAGGSGFRGTIGSAPGGATGGSGVETPAERRSAAQLDRAIGVPLERAAARLFLVGFAGTTPKADFFNSLRKREWGAVLIDSTNVTSASQLKALTRHAGGVAQHAGHVGPVFAAVQLGGKEVALPGVGPKPERLYAGPGAARHQAAIAGRALKRAGVTVTLSPSADLALAGGPWEERGYSDDPQQVTRLLRAALTGWKSAGVTPVIGHFPGEGGASQDPELGVGTVGEGRAALAAQDEAPFTALAGHVRGVQLSGALYAGFDGVTPATLDPAVVRELRARGFAGAVVSANLTAATLATGHNVGSAAVEALAAGCDVLFVPGDRADEEQAYQSVMAAVRSGRIPPARLRDALRHAALLR